MVEVNETLQGTISPVANPTADRYERRRERTKAALIEAAQGFLAASSRTDVSISEITDAADVGLGSFYNYFETKEQLFEAAINDILDRQKSYNEAITSKIEDPAEKYAVGFRLTGRLVRSYPRIVKLMLNTGLTHVNVESGLAAHALATLKEAVASGRLKCVDPEQSQAIVGGALLGLLQHLDKHPEVDAETAVDSLCVSMLQMLGMTPNQATEIIERPLPFLE